MRTITERTTIAPPPTPPPCPWWCRLPAGHDYTAAEGTGADRAYVRTHLAYEDSEVQVTAAERNCQGVVVVGDVASSVEGLADFEVNGLGQHFNVAAQVLAWLTPPPPPYRHDSWCDLIEHARNDAAFSTPAGHCVGAYVNLREEPAYGAWLLRDCDNPTGPVKVAIDGAPTPKADTWSLQEAAALAQFLIHEPGEDLRVMGERLAELVRQGSAG